jgi:Rhodopirellula transposase DDE domain
VYGTEAPQVFDHDFLSSAKEVVIPHGMYDIQRNEGYITLNTSKDTSQM